MGLGIIGTGAIASAIVTGLNSAGSDDLTILVSPRNAAVAAALAATFRNVTIAASNQAVLDGCDIVMLAIRPQVALEVLSTLRFRHDLQVISLMAITPLERVAALVAPASTVTRAIPLPMVATRCGTTVIYPNHPAATEIFDRLGTTIQVANETQFNAFSAATATLAPYFAFAAEVAGWLTRNQIQPDLARQYVATAFQGLANIAVNRPSQDFAKLAGEFATRGGTNEQVVAHLTKTGALTGISDALDAVLQRMAEAQHA